MTTPPPHISASHIPVLLDAVLEALAPRAGGVYVDATFGRGGYARAILGRADCRVWALDRDPSAIAHGRTLPETAAGRLRLVQGRFGSMDELLEGELLDAEGVAGVDGIAFDLGVSSPQLDEPERGFSFRADGPLDMRMGGDGPTASDLVNTLPEEDLADIIFRQGEERLSRRVARAIVAARAEAPIRRTGELAELVRRVVPRAKDGIDPATRTFQGLRLAVNDEVGELKRGLGAAERLLRPGGRLAVVSFHSLEDRLVKDFLRRRGGRAPAPSRHAPPKVAGPAPSFRVLTSRPVAPSAAETEQNPRARSARLRAAERTDAPAFEEAA